MSHFVQTKTSLEDAECILSAIKSFGVEPKFNAICRGWKGIETRCDIVMKLADGYDLGFNKKDGKYSIVGDFFSDYISRHLGTDDPDVIEEVGYENACITRFMDAYNRSLVEKAAMEQGYMVTESVSENGSIELELVQCY